MIQLLNQRLIGLLKGFTRGIAVSNTAKSYASVVKAALDHPKL